MYYTNVALDKKHILLKGYHDGKRIKQKLKYKPKLYIQAGPDQVPTHRDVHGNPLVEKKFKSIFECNKFIRDYKELMPLYGMERHDLAFITELNPEQFIEWKRNDIRIATIDIETTSEQGFPDPHLATESLTAITVGFRANYTVFGCGMYNNHDSDVTYIKCENEIDMIKKFILFWENMDFDIVSGWYSEGFDIPFIINRINRILGESWMRRLSPWGIVNVRENNEFINYEIAGIAHIDYQKVYKKYGKPQESYSLNHVASVVINEKKLDYSEYQSLHKLYQLDYEKFIRYNIHDVRLIDRLDNKLKFFDLVITLAYGSHSNFEHIFTQVTMWESIIHNHLINQKIVVPIKTEKVKTKKYEGAYVKEPKPNRYKWVASFDLTSMYPHIMMQFNISEDTFVFEHTPEMSNWLQKNDNLVDRIMNRDVQDVQFLHDNGLCVTANKQFFYTTRDSFMKTILKGMYKSRAEFKKKMLETEALLENDPNNQELQNQKTMYDIFQLTFKVCLNSAYGAAGNQYFRFYDTRHAEGVTTTGQLVIKWIEKELNTYLYALTGVEKDYIVYMDTDSVYIGLDGIIEEQETVSATIDVMNVFCGEKIVPLIQRSYEELANMMGCNENLMIMKREILAESAIWQAKKRYALKIHDSEGNRYEKPKTEVKGMHVKRSSTNSFFKDHMYSAIDYVLNDNRNEFLELLNSVKNECAKIHHYELSSPTGVNGIEKWTDLKTGNPKKGCPIHVRGAIVYNKMIDQLGLEKEYKKITSGDKVRYCYLTLPNPAHSHVIAFPQQIPKEFDLEKYVDVDMQIEKGYLKPMKDLADIVSWPIEQEYDLW